MKKDPGKRCRRGLISVNAFAYDVKTCMDAGMNVHLAKPFVPEKLYDNWHTSCSEMIRTRRDENQT